MNYATGQYAQTMKRRWMENQDKIQKGRQTGGVTVIEGIQEAT